MSRNVLWKILQIFATIIAVAFFLHLLATQSQSLIPAIQNLTLPTIIGVFVLYSLYFYLRASSWRFILSSLDGKVSWSSAVQTWFLGELIRYVPGNIWSFASKYHLTRSLNVKQRTVLHAMGVEVFFLLMTTSILSLPFLISQHGALPEIISIGLVMILSISVLLRKKISKVLSRLSSKNPLRFVTGFGLHLLAWIAFASGTILLTQNISVLTPIIASAIVFSWLAGYLSLITPMGLGVRETVMALALAPFLGVGSATVVALFGRVFLMLTEVVHVVFWILIREKNLIAKGKKHVTRYWQRYVLLLSIILYISTFSYLSIVRHVAFASGFDLANMDQTVWNTLHGRPFQLTGSTGTVSRFSIHADLILALLSPFYLLWNSPRMLLVLESIFLGLGTIPVYLLAKHVLKNETQALLLSWVYFFNPGMQWTNMYDFHGVSLAIPLLIATFYTALRKKWGWFVVLVALSLITKEEISLFIAILGLMLIFVWKERKIGIATTLIGLAWFPIMTFLIIPHFSPSGTYWALQWVETPKSVKTPLPTLLVDKYLFADDVIPYYKDLLKSFGGLPILGFPFLILSFPELSINVLSSHPQMRSLTMHYDSGITPALVIASIYGVLALQVILAHFKIKPKVKSLLTYGYIIIGLLIVLRFDYEYGPLPISPNCWCQVYQIDPDDIEFNKTLHMIPESATVTSSPEIRPHVSHRENSYTLPDATASAQFIALIDQNRMVGDFEPKVYELQLIQELSVSPNYQLVQHVGHFYLFEKYQ